MKPSQARRAPRRGWFGGFGGGLQGAQTPKFTIQTTNSGLSGHASKQGTAKTVRFFVFGFPFKPINTHNAFGKKRLQKGATGLGKTWHLGSGLSSLHTSSTLRRRRSPRKEASAKSQWRDAWVFRQIRAQNCWGPLFSPFTSTPKRIPPNKTNPHTQTNKQTSFPPKAGQQKTVEANRSGRSSAES